uniref:Uncharacterized protein n=1 Tax=Vespula pensylvanica TaxID=30213 RepID=A0A834PJQ2_VESPE|nr:hypothetical protein H0235_001887 [Vespula pensylvanica]
MTRVCSSAPLQFAIIAFPGKWIVLLLCYILEFTKGRGTNVIALGFRDSRPFSLDVMIEEDAKTSRRGQ